MKRNGMKNMNLGLVYVRFGKDYRNYCSFNNFDSLLKAVAFSVKNVNGTPLVKTTNQGEIACLSRTKKYIADEATRLILNINRVYTIDGDHMALYSSKRQINRLIRVCKKEGHCLSCYSFIIFHIIYININQTQRNNYQIDLDSLDKLINNLANNYYRDHKSDLAKYIIDCHKPIRKEMDKKSSLGLDDFPSIHRWF